MRAKWTDAAPLFCCLPGLRARDMHSLKLVSLVSAAAAAAVPRRLGPRLPAFLTPEAVKQLVEAYNIQPANTADPAKDLSSMMAKN